MGIYYYKGDDKKLLQKAKRDDIVSDINSKLEQWSSDLVESRKDTLAILKELFPNYTKQSEVKKIPDVYEQYKTYTSAIYKATYQNYDSIVDIEGQDLRSNNLSSIYKASLVYDFYKIELKKTLDAVLDDWVTKGEGALFVHWDEDIVQEPVVNTEIEIDEKTGEQNVKVVKGLKDKVEHAGVHIKRIDPHNLFYDKSQRHNWGMCGKIYRDFLPIQYILTNQEYTLTDAEKKELRDLVNKKDIITDIAKEKNNIDHKKVVGNCIEVLEYRGDYLMPDSNEVVKDVCIIVVAGKFLARLEKSQYPKCPIVFGTYLDRPDTTRGQSPLKPAYILADVENKCMDLTLKSWELDVNPVFLSPKGAFSSYSKLEGGKPLEYDSSILGGQAPQKVDFSAGNRGFEFQQFFKGKIEGATGITQYLQGSQAGSVRTASESTYINAGATMRIAREAYLFSEKIILPMVKMFALFKKYFDDVDRVIRVDIDGTPAFAKVDEEVRTGNYTFIIGGSQSQVEREQDINKLFMLLQAPAFQSLSQMMDPQTASEFLKWILNSANFKGTNQVFELMNLNSKIEQLGQSLGIQPQNLNGFKEDMQRQMVGSLPQIAGPLLEQQEQLPQ